MKARRTLWAWGAVVLALHLAVVAALVCLCCQYVVRVVVLVRYAHAIWLSANVRSVSAAPSIGFHDVTSTPSMSKSTPPIAMLRQ